MGRKLSEETRVKLREARLRNVENGIRAGMSNKRHTPESKAKISASLSGKQRASHPWYVGAKVYHCRRNAEHRGIEWLLSDDEAKSFVMSDCHYCGTSTIPVTHTKNWNLTGVNGIDRIDSTLGYTSTNCVAACSTCNIAKAQMNVDDFITWIKRVYSRLPQG